MEYKFHPLIEYAIERSYKNSLHKIYKITEISDFTWKVISGIRESKRDFWKT